jgi:hypothetical protein
MPTIDQILTLYLKKPHTQFLLSTKQKLPTFMSKNMTHRSINMIFCLDFSRHKVRRAMYCDFVLTL